MKKIKILGIFIMAILVLSAVSVTIPSAIAGKDLKGNGFPSGKHYTLNILGKNWEKGEDPDAVVDDPLANPIIKSDNGHRIFVRLGSNDEMKKTRIKLTPDKEEPFNFAVLDADGTDGKAEFMLPYPGDVCSPWPGSDVIPNGDDGYNEGAAAYLIFIRVLGPPRGNAKIYTSTYDGTDWILSEEKIILDNGKRPPNKAVDVTKELTTIVYNFDESDDGLERIQIFDPHYDNYFWDYDNNGLKHVQIRLYPTELFPVPWPTEPTA